MSPSNPFEKWKPAPPPEPQEQTMSRLIESERGEAKILTGLATRTSPDHALNEDSAYVSGERGIACVLDGVGGGIRGDLASRKAAQELTLERLAGRDLMTRLFMEAKRDEPIVSEEDVEVAMHQTLVNMQEAVTKLQTEPEILAIALAKAQKKSSRKLDPSNPFDRRLVRKEARSMSCTASLSKIWRDAEGKDHRTIAHVGDSRIYRLRKGTLERMTPDHSIVQTIVDLGLFDDKNVPIKDDQDITRNITLTEIKKHAKGRPDLAGLVYDMELRKKDRISIENIRHYVLQTIGSPDDNKTYYGETLQPFIRTDGVEDGDIELLCSDGLSDVLTDSEIQDVLIEYADDPLKAAQELERRATERSNADVHVRAKPDDVTVLVTVYRKKEKTP